MAWQDRNLSIIVALLVLLVALLLGFNIGAWYALLELRS
jgi:hypothetical protein